MAAKQKASSAAISVGTLPDNWRELALNLHEQAARIRDAEQKRSAAELACLARAEQLEGCADELAEALREPTAKERHLMDVYDSLGVTWGDDPFWTITRLRHAPNIREEIMRWSDQGGIEAAMEKHPQREWFNGHGAALQWCAKRIRDLLPTRARPVVESAEILSSERRTPDRPRDTTSSSSSDVGAEARTGGGWHGKEICICAAIRTKDGTVIRGHRHPDCFANMQQRTPKPELDHDAPWQGQGFVTSKNRFVDRAEGMELMAAAGAFSAHTGLSLAGVKAETPLFSEDLY